MDAPLTNPITKAPSKRRTWLLVVGLVYVLLIGVSVIGDGFNLAAGGADGAREIFAFATNPLVGVLLGVLATALVQSSSTVSSVIVGLVAGGLPVSLAVPMIMGANMGTTVTNTIVALGAVGEGDAFRRSFTAATVHDIFNFLAIAILLPIEIVFSPLEKSAGALATSLAGEGSASVKGLNPLAFVTDPPADAIAHMGGLADNDLIGGLGMIFLGVTLVVGAVLKLGSALKEVMVGRALTVLHGALGRGPLAGISSGALITILVQSSSTTTSLIVPLAGAGSLSLKQVYPFTLGANIGTTITALLAATAVNGEFEVFALQIALVHLQFNVVAVLGATYIPLLNQIPMRGATLLGALAERNRGLAFAYLCAVFFIIPGIAFGIGQILGERIPGGL